MERNYDEIIADMLRQIDRHTEELTLQSRKSDELWKEQSAFNAGLMSRLEALDESSKAQNAIRANHLELIINTANILDRILTRNELKM